jgi:uncharacterized protein with HEPN domain
MRDDRTRLLDILEAIEQIEKYSSRGHDAFVHDELIRVWIVHHIQTIGEAAASLMAEIREQYSQVPWARIVAMRNMLVHEYFGIDWEEVWETAIRDLPQLKTQIQSILGELVKSSDRRDG